jgi:hypothetical protein
MKKQNFIRMVIPAISIVMLNSCSQPLINISPQEFSDTTPVTISVNAKKGNQGLRGFKGDVFVHVGVITDSSVNANEWRYVKFKWGSTEDAAKAVADGEDSWSYTIPNIRKFLEVKEGEKILNLAILFREGNCFDTLCRTLRNEDKTDMMIAIPKKE